MKGATGVVSGVVSSLTFGSGSGPFFGDSTTNAGSPRVDMDQGAHLLGLIFDQNFLNFCQPFCATKGAFVVLFGWILCAKLLLGVPSLQ
jgi:hypothetical protein